MKNLLTKRNILIAVAILLVAVIGVFLVSKSPSLGLASPTESAAFQQAVYDHYMTFRSEDRDRCPALQKDDYQISKEVDLDGDGTDEYFVSIDFFCGEPVRGGGGGGDFLILAKDSEGYRSLGTVAGHIGSPIVVTDLDGVSFYKTVITLEGDRGNQMRVQEWMFDGEKYEQLTNMGFVLRITLQESGAIEYEFTSQKTGKNMFDYQGEGAIKTVTGTGPFDNDHYFRKDITGDGVPEIFIRTAERSEEPEDHVSPFHRIFKLDGERLLNVGAYSWEAGAEIPFDEIDYNGQFVGMVQKEENEWKKTYFKFDGDRFLDAVKVVSFSFPPSLIDQSCDVTRYDDANPEWVFLDSTRGCNAGVFDFDLYANIDPVRQIAEIDGKRFVSKFESFAERDGSGDPSSGNIQILEAGKKVLEDNVGGHNEHSFIDIDKDGIPELEVNSDGGGNMPTCFKTYYRWTGKAFERVKFEGIEQDEISCHFGGGLKYENGKTLYVGITWRRQYPEAREAVFDKSYSEYPLEARLCKEVETTYEYRKESGIFAKISERTLQENYDTYQDGLTYYCY